MMIKCLKFSLALALCLCAMLLCGSTMAAELAIPQSDEGSIAVQIEGGIQGSG